MLSPAGSGAVPHAVVRLHRRRTPRSGPLPASHPIPPLPDSGKRAPCVPGVPSASPGPAGLPPGNLSAIGFHASALAFRLIPHGKSHSGTVCAGNARRRNRCRAPALLTRSAPCSSIPTISISSSNITIPMQSSRTSIGPIPIATEHVEIFSSVFCGAGTPVRQELHGSSDDTRHGDSVGASLCTS